MNLTETNLYGINEKNDFCGCFKVDDLKYDIFIKEYVGDEPHIYLRNPNGNICRIKLRSPEYITYSSNTNGLYMLTKKEAKMFDDYMHENIPCTSMNHWLSLAIQWNAAWSAHYKGNIGKIDYDVEKCPNYNNLIK